MSFYCRNAYFVFGVPNSSCYSDPASRSTPRLRINENPRQVVTLRLRNHTMLRSKREEGSEGTRSLFQGIWASLSTLRLPFIS